MNRADDISRRDGRRKAQRAPRRSQDVHHTANKREAAKLQKRAFSGYKHRRWIMVRAERAGATRTYARSALARHPRGARRLDTAEQANQHNRSNADAASRCRRVPKCAWIAQQHKHPRSQRAPSDIALTEPDRDMSSMSAVKLVKWCR